MDADRTAKEVLRIRKRLEEIERTRERLPDDAFAKRADLLNEEHELRAHLAELQKAIAEETTGSETPPVPTTDTETSPNLF